MIKELYCVEVGRRYARHIDQIYIGSFTDLQKAISFGKEMLSEEKTSSYCGNWYCMIWKEPFNLSAGQLEDIQNDHYLADIMWEETDTQKLVMAIEKNALGIVRVVV